VPLDFPDLPACAGCGVCCHLTVELAASGDDVPEHLVAEYDGIRYMDQGSNGACAALDPATRLCTIYDRRPAVCRAFERGSQLCRWVLGRSGEGAASPSDRPQRLR
jgi:Fe-S-cluster containining protein